MGDLNVELFFVLGGFLIPLTSSGKIFSYKNVIRKWASLILPAVLLTSIVFASLLMTRDIIGNWLPISCFEYLDDIYIYISGQTHFVQREYDYIPNILYQLWFVFPFVKRWIIAYCTHHMCKKYRLHTLFVCIVIACFIDLDNANILIGLIFGEVALLYSQGNRIDGFASLIAISLCPIVFSSVYYKTSVFAKRILFSLFGFSFWMMWKLRAKFPGEKYIYKIGTLTTEIFYVHSWIIYLSTFVYESMFKKSQKFLFLIYVVTVAIVLITAYIFKAFITTPLNRKVNDILNRICKK